MPRSWVAKSAHFPVTKFMLKDPRVRSGRVGFTHAVGVIFCRPPLGDLDLAPGPMDVDADEEIDGAVAAVLVIVPLELTRLGRDRLANLADELDRALVEADHRPLGVG